MDTRKRTELVYRCIQISAWAKFFPPKNQTQRELLVAIGKLNRLRWKDEFHYLSSVESIKRSKRLGHKKSKEMGLQYERVVQLVSQALSDKALASGKVLTAEELHEQMYGPQGLLTKAVEYARVQAAKN